MLRHGRDRCEAGCMAFDGGEVKHHRDCVHYPDSLTKVWHDLEAKYLEERSDLLVALSDAIMSPMGVVPRSADDFYDTSTGMTKPRS